MNKKKCICITIVISLLVILVALQFRAQKIESLKSEREAHFKSILYCLYNAEHQSDDGSMPTEFEYLLKKYTDDVFRGSLKELYAELGNDVDFRYIEYIPGERIYEAKNYPIGIFSSDHLEIRVSDWTVRWVRSGDVIYEINPTHPKNMGNNPGTDK